MPPGQPTAIPVDASSGLWDRLTSWASENKAVVYTIAGVAFVVTGAGVVYYLNGDSVRLRSALCFYHNCGLPPLIKGELPYHAVELITDSCLF